MLFDWRWVEPYEGEYRLAIYDEIYDELLARGIRPLCIAMYTPSWALDVPCNQWTSDCRYPPARARLGAWREFVALIARRYPQAAGIEVWNEPNEGEFWQPVPDAARYTELMREAYLAVKGVNPDMPVISGGLSNRQAAEGTSVPMRAFARAIYEAGGRDHMDALGFHPYTWSVSDQLLHQTVRDMREVRDASGDRDKPLWATELGLSTTGPRPWLRVSEQEQASGLASFYRQLMAMPDVQAVIVHTLIPVLHDPALSAEPGFALTRSDHSPRPAFCALATERGGYTGSGCPG